ncbi:MAG: hypothetical protein JO157_15075, partial [Acetobacteraceae bacterium]|nr:hypothetical protein [Acetobacteraceae bacterium]
MQKHSLHWLQGLSSNDSAPLAGTGDACAQRIAEVAATGLLDAPAEDRFDRLTRLARRLLRAPVA